MSALRSKHPAHRQIADALSWLREKAQPGAHLHADTRSLAAGDVFLAYAVDGADNRPFIDNAIDDDRHVDSFRFQIKREEVATPGKIKHSKMPETLGLDL